MIRSLLGSRLARDTSGVTVIEFAIVGPVLVLMIMGMFDLGHQLYVNSVMQGSLQQASRSSTLETGASQTSTIDAKLTKRLKDISPGGTVVITRKNYQNFTDITLPEEWTDTDADGECNNGEPFQDINFNGGWDADRGRDGAGGARDAVLLTAVITYDRLFPMAGLLGFDEEVSVSGTTVLRNQPYNEQADRTPVVGNCV
ncbi:TadE/TadG family type IV pilus assembly protein [Allopontixanthobacter sediminis]|uniref:Pilus assembly protein n=1 Tax=Allopontixanthobacter sediminis TaxID=1689985 RepID=A0A845B6L3_9SPHN|nr:TadE family protein [Allopontixanthobacter sediminis]MXP43269.1 pilus assembly protein [Allopontixanthobacter sediminis]